LLLSILMTLGIFWTLYDVERIVLNQPSAPTHFYKLYKLKRVTLKKENKKRPKSELKKIKKKEFQEKINPKTVPRNLPKKQISESKPLHEMKDTQALKDTSSTESTHDGEPLDITELDQEVVITARLIPKYPAIAKKAGKEAMVLVEIIIDEKGHVLHAVVVYVSLKNYGFEEAALNAANQLLFEPVVQDGRAIKVKINYPINFVLLE
jgi:TonB family protein